MTTTQIRGTTQIMDDSVPAAKVTSGVIIAAGTHAFAGDQSMGGFKLTSLGTPTADTDAVTKAYADALRQGLDVKQSVRVASTANLTLSAPGAAIDGITLTSGDRVLVKDQSTGADNGIYVFNGAASAMTRATDADVSAEVTSGMYMWVVEGTAGADSGWVLTTNDPITLGTTALVFVQFSGAGQITAGTGMTKTGNTLDVGAGDGITVGVDAVNANIDTAAGLVFDGSSPKKIQVNLGAGLEFSSGAIRIAASLAGNGISGGAGSALAIDVVTRETPSGTVNGSNVTFTLANTPVSGTEHVYLNGILQDAGAGNDYTISGVTITFATAPVSGDKIRVTYFK